MKKNIKNIDFAEWPEIFSSLGLKKYTPLQVYQWLFKKGAASFDEMTNLSKEARAELDKNFSISRLKVVDILTSSDGTKKFLFELEDGERIESVLIPAETGRVTLCISSQVGCALGCKFCRTAELGFKRNLNVSEIVDQVLEVQHSLSVGAASVRRYRGGDAAPTNNSYHREITNLVLMGMGEPLENYDNVKQAIDIMKDKNGLELAKRRITLSTSGIVPGIKRMAEDKLGVKLAISLNATTDEVRRKIMPIAKKYSIEELIEAAQLYHPPDSRWRTTFEYVMIDGLNDSMEDAERLAVLMKKFPSKVNLIPFNPYPGSPYKKPKEEVLKQFYNILYNKGIQVNTRKSMGADIQAACGQLAGTDSNLVG